MKHAIRRGGLVRVPLVFLLLAVGAAGARAQLRPSYDHGQWVSPAFEGWVENEDGTIDILFGYMNRNWLEELHVPIGPENRFLGEKTDLGQPTRFLPRRNRFVFRVRAPEGLTEDDELVWELATRGNTQRAYASIKPDFKLDNVAIMSETGSLGAGTSDAEIRANIPPSIRVEGEAERTVRVGEPLGLVAVVTDDGVPERSERADGPPEDVTPEELLARAMRAPVRVTVAKTNALHMTWFPYRGGGSVEFAPPPGEAVGGHEALPELPVVADVGRAGGTGRRPVGRDRDLPGAGRLRPAGASRRRGPLRGCGGPGPGPASGC